MASVTLFIVCIAFTLMFVDGNDRSSRIIMEEVSLDGIVSQLANLTARVEKCEAGPVAFKAHLTKSITPADGEKIVFSDLQLNLGGAYHPYIGGFLAPYNGTYLFSVSICSTSGHFIVLDLMRNTDVIGRILAGDADYDDCSSETTITQLKSGDEVFVQHHSNVGDFIHYQQHTINSFTGTLLQRI